MFERKGLILVAAAKVSQERLMEVALEAGADDLKREGETFEIICAPENLTKVSDALAAEGIEADGKQLTWIPTNIVEVSDVETARSVLALMEALDDHDSANFTIPKSALAAPSP